MGTKYIPHTLMCAHAQFFFVFSPKQGGGKIQTSKLEVVCFSHESREVGSGKKYTCRDVSHSFPAWCFSHPHPVFLDSESVLKTFS